MRTGRWPADRVSPGGLAPLLRARPGSGPRSAVVLPRWGRLGAGDHRGAQGGWPADRVSLGGPSRVPACAARVGPPGGRRIAPLVWGMALPGRTEPRPGRGSGAGAALVSRLERSEHVFDVLLQDSVGSGGAVEDSVLAGRRFEGGELQALVVGGGVVHGDVAAAVTGAAEGDKPGPDLSHEEAVATVPGACGDDPDAGEGGCQYLFPIPGLMAEGAV